MNSALRRTAEHMEENGSVTDQGTGRQILTALSQLEAERQLRRLAEVRWAASAYVERSKCDELARNYLVAIDAGDDPYQAALASVNAAVATQTHCSNVAKCARAMADVIDPPLMKGIEAAKSEYPSQGIISKTLQSMRVGYLAAQQASKGWDGSDR